MPGVLKRGDHRETREGNHVRADPSGDWRGAATTHGAPGPPGPGRSRQGPCPTALGEGGQGREEPGRHWVLNFRPAELRARQVTSDL